MSQDQSAPRGFSFQLSESAPPVEATETESGPAWFSPQDDRLDLDLDAFDPSRTPAPVGESGLPPAMADGVEAVLAAVRHEIPGPTHPLLDDTGPEGPSAAEFLSPPPPALSPLPAASAEAPSGEHAPRPVSVPTSPQDALLTPSARPVEVVDATSPPPPVAEAPVVRRIAFPRIPDDSIPAPSFSEPPASEPLRSEPTLFASSVSSAPRARLESDDEPLDLPPCDLPTSTLSPVVGPSSGSRLREAIRGLDFGKFVRTHWAHSGRAGLERARALGSHACTWGRRGMGMLDSARDRGRLALESVRRPNTPDVSTDSAAEVPTAHDEAPRLNVPREPPTSSPPAGGVSSASKTSALEKAKPFLSVGGALFAAALCYGAATKVAALATTTPLEELDQTAQAAEPEASGSPDGEGDPEAIAGPAADAAPEISLSNARPHDPKAVNETEEVTKNLKDSNDKKESNQSPQTETLGLPDGMSWPGKGLIEVVTDGKQLVYVDGVFTGRGPLRRIPIEPGSHEVVIVVEGKERSHNIDVSAERRTRIVFGD